MTTLSLIARHRDPGGTDEWITHVVPHRDSTTVLELLQTLSELSERAPIHDVGCGEGLCGSCAMRIDGVPGLACRTVIEPGQVVPLRLEPLELPVIRDLVVDRSQLERNLAALPNEEPAEFEAESAADNEVLGACIRCGICNDVCPESHASSPYVGPAALVRYAFREPANGLSTVTRDRALLGPDGLASCGWSSRCTHVCPAGITIRTELERLTRRGVISGLGRVLGT